MNADAIDTVAVLGLGTMGHGIAQSFAAAGRPVRCYDDHPAARTTLHDRVRANLQRMAEAGIGSAEAIAPTLARLTPCTTEAEAVGPAQFVVEVVREDLAAKQALFGRVEALIGPQTILASNSSSFPISETARGLQRPERAILTHWFNPPHLVPVVEVVPGKQTSEETTRTTLRLHEAIGKTAVRINQELPGFLVNRVQVAMFREIFDLLERGVASAGDIDRAICGSMGLRLAALGPLQIIDFAGWDITGSVYQNLIPHLRADAQLPACIRELLEQGRFGVKAGKGIYDYLPEAVEARTAQRDRLYLALVKLLHTEGAVSTATEP
jgi:3-hydroxybutyryl-CoA dehydrogenase